MSSKSPTIHNDYDMLDIFQVIICFVACSFKGMRDDLTFLLEEELTSINLCALHCELRNTEQLLANLGLYSHKLGTLKDCNAALARYGPETTGNRITIKMHYLRMYTIK